MYHEAEIKRRRVFSTLSSSNSVTLNNNTHRLVFQALWFFLSDIYGRYEVDPPLSSFSTDLVTLERELHAPTIDLYNRYSAATLQRYRDLVNYPCAISTFKSKLETLKGVLSYYNTIHDSGRSPVSLADLFFFLLRCVAAERVKVTVRDILHLGLSLNIRSASGASVLMLAAREGLTDVVEALIEAGMSVHWRDREQQTALVLASRHQHVETMRVLLEAGARVDIDANSNIMIEAARYGDAQVVDSLISAQCDVNARNSFGLSALMLAAGNAHIHVAQRLMAAGATVNAATSIGITALNSAVLSGSSEMVRILLDANACTETRYNAQQTPLSLAPSLGHADMVAALIGAGATVHVSDGSGQSPWMIAAGEGRNDILELLLQAKADLFVEDLDCTSALMLAAAKGHSTTVVWLMERCFAALCSPSVAS